MNKEQLLIDLKTNVYVRLAPTEHGVGIVAIKDIPCGIDPFVGCMPDCKFIPVPKEEVEQLEPELFELVKDFCPLQDGEYHLPSTGLNSIDKSYYLNHSKEPNMVARDEGEIFITAREIKKGEELTVDYETYDDVGL